MTEIITATLITYAISRLLSDYDGIFNIFRRIRSLILRLSVTGAKLFSCAVCLSIWVAVVVTLIMNLSLKEYLAVLGLTVFMLEVAE